ncbi:MAG: hypothetical protein FJZ58_05965 [Chlamydiae bacterium]|nr:hypothetical protein [Chlamydiota bacterium]
MKKIISFLSIASLSSLLCSYTGDNTPDASKKPDFMKRQRTLMESNFIEKTVVKNVLKELTGYPDLQLVGVGVHGNWSINQVNMGLCLYKEIDLVEARKLLTLFTENLLSYINKRPEQFASCFDPYPVTTKELNIRIWVQPDHKKPPVDHIDYIAKMGDTCIYQIAEPAPVYSKVLCKEAYSALPGMTASSSSLMEENKR